MKSKTKRNHGVTVVLAVALVVALVLAAVLLIAAGYAEAAMEALFRMGEDGTLERLEAVIVDDVIPMLGGIAAAVCGAMALLFPTLKKLKEAKDKLDEGTAEAVKTYGERQRMQAEMQAFLEEQRAASEALRQEQVARLDALVQEQRASLAADRAAIKRMEGKVDGIRRVEAAAFCATGELVKKGTATQIGHILEETEGAEAADDGEGGEDGEAGGYDGEAVEATEAHR